jgi:peptidoglycan/LPS O-acetylase OafA/YrhL
MQWDVQNAFGFLNFGLLRGAAGFSVGAAAYLLFEKAGQHFVLPAFAIYFLLASLAYFFLIESWSQTTVILFYAVLFVCLISFAANDHITILSSRPVVLIGSISYSIYLLHIPIYSILSLAFGDSLVRGPGKLPVLAIVLASSYLSYRWVERPSQYYILRWFGCSYRTSSAELKT